MKWFKYGFIVLLLLFISGCSASYNLTITDSYIDEDISAVFENNPDNLGLADMKYYPLHYSDSILYDKEIDVKDGNIYFKLHYRYNFDEFKDADSYNIPFEYRNVKNENNIFSIDCKNLREFSAKVNFDIKIKTDRKVLKHNADSVKGNTYIWHVKYKEKDKLHVSIKIKTNELSKKAVAKKIILYILIGIGIISVIALGLLFMRSRYKKSNKF